ncbi:MAG TPA: thioesterase family protein [Bacteroidales bacterium]|nr:thioesterase family protein [Bacteroidales bacterium]
MLSSEVKIRVRYGETDRMGYLYYGNYPLYYEVGRTELLRKHGFAYKILEDSGILLPVADMKVEYYFPALYDEELTVKTSILKKPGVKIEFLYEIFNSENLLINKATTTLVFVKASDRKPCKPPKDFSDLVDRFF